MRGASNGTASAETAAALDDALSGAARQRIVDVIARLKATSGALLPILHGVQDAIGYIPPAAIALIARELNLTRAEVHGVVSFYHHFRTAPAGRHVFRLCRAEACQAVGARALEAHAKRALGIDFHATTADGAITLEPVYCLGNCACGPSLLIDDEELHGRVDAAAFDALVARASGEAGTSAGARLRATADRAQARGDRESLRVFVPCEAAALAVGAEATARAIAAEAARRGADLRLVRNGSRGMFWLEPLVEVETAAGRIAYGPVRATDVAGLFDADFLAGRAHPLRLGPTADIPWLKRQQRLCFARVGVVDPVDPEDYARLGGWRGLERALGMDGAAIADAIADSGLRGRGGAAFPAGIKWKTVLDSARTRSSDSRCHVVCNADEGDSGTFSDRMLMEGDPFALIEGMTIAGIAVGATQGFIYLRSEYPHARRTLERALAAARAAGWLGADLRGSGRRFDIELRIGAGAYICGEETSLLDSLEGKRGQVRAKPPVPAIKGLFGRPTLVHNVITLASVPIILEKGAAYYRDFGSGRSRGTLPIQLAGNIKHGGLVELAFGATLRELLHDYGGGSLSGRPLRAVQVGGPLGAYLPESQFDTPTDYEAFAAIGAMLGHGGIVAFDDTVDMAEQARYAMEFCALESCGKCTPCRIGSTRGVEVLDRIRAGTQREKNFALLEDLCETMRHGSLCAMGGLTPDPVQSAIRYFPEDFSG